jgi:hypothetical protein
MKLNAWKNCLLFSTVYLAAATVSAFGQEKVTLQIAGFSVGQKDPSSEFGQGLSMMRQPGLEVDLHFHAPKETVLSLDTKQTTIELKQDDGTELPLEEMFDGNFRLSLNEKPEKGLVSMRTAIIPAKGTKSIQMEGNLVLVVGRELKTGDVEIVLDEGKELKFGPLDVTVGQIGDAYGEPFKKSFELSSKKPFDSIATIEFVDAKGKAVESSSGGSGSFGFGGDITYSRSWQIASDAKSIKAKISYYTKTETLKVPCKLEFGLGL